MSLTQTQDQPRTLPTRQLRLPSTSLVLLGVLHDRQVYVLEDSNANNPPDKGWRPQLCSRCLRMHQQRQHWLSERALVNWLWSENPKKVVVRHDVGFGNRQ
jgi:hypothetical protein